MVYADEILDYSGQRKTGVTAGSYGPASDVSPEAGGTITVPQLTVNEKGLITGAVERTVTLPSGGGGGGGEEQFAQVYTTTLSEDTAQVMITSADMGGSFVDAVVYVTLNNATAGTILAGGFLSGATSLRTCGLIEMTDAPPYLVFSCESRNGLLYGGYSMYDDDRESIAQQYHTAQGYTPEYYGGGEYPNTERPGITAFALAFSDGTTPIPAGTTITIYARKAVQTGGE